MDSYDKVNKAVMVCSTIQAIRPTQSKSKSAHHHHVVPVTFDYSSQQPKGNKLEAGVEEASFSNYINRVKIGMRTKSTLADYAPLCDSLSDCECDEKRNDCAVRDEFSEYLDRARIKIRTTSSIPAGRFS